MFVQVTLSSDYYIRKEKKLEVKERKNIMGVTGDN